MMMIMMMLLLLVLLHAACRLPVVSPSTRSLIHNLDFHYGVIKVKTVGRERVSCKR